MHETDRGRGGHNEGERQTEMSRQNISMIELKENCPTKKYILLSLFFY